MRAKAPGKNRGLRRPRRGLDARFTRHLEHLQDLKRPIVLIAGEASAQSIPDWRARFQYRLHVIAPAAEDLALQLEGVAGARTDSDAEIDEYLTAVGPVAAVIDERSPDATARMLRWQQVFLHVTATGSFITTADDDAQEWEGAVGALGAPAAEGENGAEIRSSIARTWSSDHHAVIEKDRDHLVKVKDEDALTLLPPRLGAQNVRVLGSRPSATVGEALVVRSFGEPGEYRMPARKMRAPELRLLEFRGRTEVRSDMLAVNGATVLPSSFKHPWRSWNDQLDNHTDKVASLRNDADPVEHLNGSFFDLTSAVPGDRGHFLTESLPKLWGWNEAKDRDPGLRVLYRGAPADPEAPFQRGVLEHFGIAPEDIHVVLQDVSVERFVTASQAWQNGGWHFAHPVNRKVWATIRSGATEGASAGPEKIFVTRRSDTAETPGPRNARAVEERFADGGYAVLDLDTAALEDVVQAFVNASTVAGFAGAGMYQMLFAHKVQRVVVLTHGANTGRNEHLFAALRAQEIDYLWSKPDVEQPAGKFSAKAFNSAWDFDFAANADALEELLR